MTCTDFIDLTPTRQPVAADDAAAEYGPKLPTGQSAEPPRADAIAQSNIDKLDGPRRRSMSGIMGRIPGEQEHHRNGGHPERSRVVRADGGLEDEQQVRFLDQLPDDSHRESSPISPNHQPGRT